MYFGLNSKLLSCQYLLTKKINKKLLQKFEIGCLYEVVVVYCLFTLIYTKVHWYIIFVLYNKIYSIFE